MRISAAPSARRGLFSLHLPPLFGLHEKFHEKFELCSRSHARKRDPTLRPAGCFTEIIASEAAALTIRLRKNSTLERNREGYEFTRAAKGFTFVFLRGLFCREGFENCGNWLMFQATDLLVPSGKLCPPVLSAA